MVEVSPTEDHADVLPIVGRKTDNRAVWIFGLVLGASALGLFVGLESRRNTLSSPAVSVPAASSEPMISAPPELAIPPFPEPSPASASTEPGSNAPSAADARAATPATPFRAAPVRLRPATAYLPSSAPQAAIDPMPPVKMPVPQTVSAPGPLPPLSPSEVARLYGEDSSKSRPPKGLEGKDGGDRTYASTLANPSMTVPQGTVIQAVLETALDSSRPGYARAIISRDVSSFDGSQVLIPRGSKLFGEYKSDLGRGQNRALIQWHRLTRPDGATIDLDSPSADPLGGAGIKGRVNTHFFERFGGMILQSTLDVGVQLATNKVAGGTVLLALPNSAQNLNPIRPEDVKPTVKVRQGTSVSVFVVRDLDFSDVGQ